MLDLLYFKAQHSRLRTAWTRCVLSVLLIEGIAALIQGLDNVVTFCVVVVVPGQTILQPSVSFESLVTLASGSSSLSMHTLDRALDAERNLSAPVETSPFFFIFFFRGGGAAARKLTARGWHGGLASMSFFGEPCNSTASYQLSRRSGNLSGELHFNLNEKFKVPTMIA